jgi:outer membrane protein assembly factor BamB
MCIALAFGAVVVQAAPGDLVWEFKTDSWVRTSPAVADDGSVVFGSDDGFVYALNPDGTETWRFQTPGSVWSSPAIGDDGTVYIASGGGFLFALAADGSERWRVDIGAVDYVKPSPALGSDGTIYVGSNDGTFYAVLPGGTVAWTYETGKLISSSPAVGPDGAVFFGSDGGHVYGLNPDGTLRFRHAVRHEANVRSSPAISADGTVIIGASDGYLYALTPDGDLRWEVQVSANVLFSSPAIGSDGTVYVGSYDKKLHAISSTGAPMWGLALDDLVSSSPTVGEDGTIYVGTEAGTLYAVGPNGDVLWTFSVGAEIYYCSPMLAEDGTLYVGSFDRHIYALETSSMGLADSPWPTFGRNPRRTAWAGVSTAAEPSQASSACSATLWDLPYPSSFPAGMALDGQGFVYVAAAGGREIYRLDPVDGVFRSWGVGSRPEDVTVANGVVFCTVRDDNQLVYFDPAGVGVSSVSLPTPGLGLTEIQRGPDTPTGSLVFWVAAREAQSVLCYEYNPMTEAPGIVGVPMDNPASHRTVAMTPQTVAASYERFPYDVSLIPAAVPLSAANRSASFTDWTFPLGDFWVEDIAVADDGTLWISFGAPFLLQFDPMAETMQQMETIRNVAIFQGLLPAADGSIWFGNIVEGAIGHFNPATGLSEVWRIPGTGEVYDLAFDADGGIWYTDRVNDAIGCLDVWTNEATVYQLPAESEPLYLAVDEDGAVWFTAGRGNYIGRLTPPG